MFTQWEVMCTMSITEMKEWKRKKIALSQSCTISLTILKENKICTLTKWPIQEELILVTVAWSNKKCFHPPCMGCWPIAGYSPHSNQHFVRFCLQFTRSHLDSWVDSSIVRVVSCQRAQHNHAPCLFSNADLLTWLGYLSVTASLKYACRLHPK